MVRDESEPRYLTEREVEEAEDTEIIEKRDKVTHLRVDLRKE